MVIEFKQDYLRALGFEEDALLCKELYDDGKCRDKKHRFQPQVVAKYQKRIDTLTAATKKEDLFVFRSLNFEALHGDKEGLFSIRVDKQYRIEFAIREEGGEAVISVAEIYELSNHYS